MSELNLTDENFKTEITDADGVSLVDFYAVWCGPCKMLAVTIAELAEEYAGRVKICKLNVEEAPAVSSAFQVSSVPTVIIFKGGKPVAHMVGNQSKAELKKQLDAVL